MEQGTNDRSLCKVVADTFLVKFTLSSTLSYIITACGLTMLTIHGRCVHSQAWRKWKSSLGLGPVMANNSQWESSWASSFQEISWRCASSYLSQGSHLLSGKCLRTEMEHRTQWRLYVCSLWSPYEESRYCSSSKDKYKKGPLKSRKGRKEFTEGYQ